MKKVTKILAALAAVATLVPMAACGGSSDTTADGKTKLTWYTNENEKNMKPIVQEFEKENPDIDLDFSSTPTTSEYISTLQTRIVGNQAPDVFLITSENINQLVNNGYAMDLTGQGFTKNLADSNKEFLSRNGKLYGVSVASWASGLVFNKKLLAKVGATKVPDTWEGFLALCKKLKAAGITPFLEAMSDSTVTLDALSGSKFASSGNKQVLRSVFTGKTTFEKQMTPVVNEWYKQYSEGLVTKDTVGMSGQDIKSQFLSGKLAMMVSSSWDIADFDKAKLDWGMSLFPAYDSKSERFGVGSENGGYTIYSKLSGKKLEAAKKLLSFLTSKTALKIDNEKKGDIVNTKDYTAKVDPGFEDIYKNGIQKGNIFLSVNEYTKGADVLTSEEVSLLQQLIQGQISPAEVGKQMDAKLASIG
jgi:raffinose/stachyose/melibiose transport system substrate-binding protein